MNNIPPYIEMMALGHGPKRWEIASLTAYSGERWLYVLGREGIEYVKVGISGSPQKRHRTIQKQIPFELDLMLAEKMATHQALFVEAHCRLQMDQQHTRGEWYRIHPMDAMAAVKKAVRAYPSRYPEAPPITRPQPTLSAKEIWRLVPGDDLSSID